SGAGTRDGGDGGLSTGAKAGIGVGAALAAAALLAGLLYYFKAHNGKGPKHHPRWEPPSPPLGGPYMAEPTLPNVMMGPQELSGANAAAANSGMSAAKTGPMSSAANSSMAGAGQNTAAAAAGNAPPMHAGLST